MTFIVEIEIHMGKSSSNTLAGQNITLKNIGFDVPIDESLVSMEPSSEYTLRDSRTFLLELNQGAFLKLLQLWTKYSPNGSFPDELRYVDPVTIVQNSHEQMNMSQQEANGIGILYMRWINFLGALGNNGAEYLYSGKGARYGEMITEIFRYHLPNTQSWRVVYSDLHVETIQMENPAR